MSESKILLLSVLVTAFFAFLGIIWGIFADSGMIIFDGIYSLISVGLSLLSLWVLQQLQDKRDDVRFPFGKAHFEPMVIVFKSLMIIGVCLFSAINSFSEVISGGRYVEPGQGILFALISAMGCILMTVIVQRQNLKIESSLLKAEVNQWFGDSILSSCVLVGFTLSYLLIDTPLEWLTPYADPGMVMLASSAFIIIPMKSFTAAFKEILFYKTDASSLAVVDREANKIAEEITAEYKIRMVNVGRELSIEVNFLLDDRVFTVSEMDIIRKRIAAIAATINDRYWLNVNFSQIRAVL